MKLTIFGATGRIGQRIVQEALARGHKITAALRDPSRLQFRHERLHTERADVTRATDVARVAAGHDAVVSAVGPGAGGDAAVIVAAAKAFIEGLASAGTARLMVVGGAGTLEIRPGVQRLDTPEYPDIHRPSGYAQREALALYRAGTLDWTYLSPPVLIEPGERTGSYRDHFAAMHHHHLVRDILHDRQVVGDEEVGRAEAGLQLCELVQDRRLHGDVKGRGRLVADDDLGGGRKRPGDADALLLSAGQLAGIARQVARIELHRLQELRGAALQRGAGESGVQPERTRDDIGHGVLRVQRGVGILEDELDGPLFAPAASLHQGCKRLAVQRDEASVGRQQAGDATRERGLAGAAFADDRECRTGFYGKAHIVDRAHRRGRKPAEQSVAAEGTADAFDHQPRREQHLADQVPLRPGCPRTAPPRDHRPWRRRRGCG